MFTRLLESKANRERSLSGGVVSVAMHTAIIGVAIYATAQARVEAEPQSHVVRPSYWAPPRLPVLPRPASPSPAVARNRLVFVDPAINVSLPAIDVPLPAVASADLRRDPIAGSDSFGAQDLAREGSDGTFTARQVEKQVSLVSGNAPRYPEALRRAGIEGQVVARFVVDEDGRVEQGTLKFVRSDNPLFEEPVRAALARMRFTPAAVGGKKVRQLVEMPFVFTLSR